MAKTHYKQLINPLYLGAYSLDDGKGGYTDIVRTIASIKVEEIVGTDGKKETCPIARFTEGGKPMILNTTNMKMLEKLFKTPYIEDWCGRKVQIGVEAVRAFGETLDALRIRKTLPREQGAAKCLDCNGEIVAAGGMNAAQVVAYARKRFGADLCGGCMKKRDEAKKAAEKERIEQGAEEMFSEVHNTNDPHPVESTEPEQAELSEFERAMKENG